MYLEKLRKKLRLWYIIIWVGVSLCAGVAAGTVWIDVPTWKILLVLVVPIFASGLGINLYWNKQFTESVRLLFPVLDRDPDQFIADFEELTSGKHVRRMVATTYYNNMGTAYARKKCYREALSYYEKVNTKKIKGAMANAVYWGNVALMHFELKETDKALEICEKKQSYFQKFPLGSQCKYAPDLPLALARLEICRLMAIEEYEAAQSLLDELRSYAVKQPLLDDLNTLEARLAEKHS